MINTRALCVSYLDEADARELIRRPIERFADVYDEQAVEDIVRLTRGQPYLVQLVCYELVERLNLENRRRVSPLDVEQVVPVVFERGFHYFREFWEESLAPEQLRALVGLVHGDPSSGEAGRGLHALVAKEVLERGEGGYRFQVPLLRRWVEHQVREMQP